MREPDERAKKPQQEKMKTFSIFDAFVKLGDYNKEKKKGRREYETMELFDTIAGPRSEIYIFRSFKEDTEIYGKLIDYWASVLNSEETLRIPNSPHRLFCSHQLIWMFNNEKLYDAQRLDAFSKRMFENLGRVVDFRNLKGL
ncbi:hypothetical protein L1987_57988 [Smallanthus sonchifolius]|uniref:Uncharacterized protein n=1 Tax=Smallanthus sonchifolius TaxID=185202 RepID=A0ACB9DE99_9ASTR|nr:hypothetical protein L1987_57988 [Smallanthus sonchifolius]